MICCLAALYGAIVVLWALSWVHYIFIGWASGGLVAVGPQQALWDRRDDWGVFAYDGIVAIGWQKRAMQIEVPPERLALPYGRPRCFFYVISPIVWDRGTVAWPRLMLDVSGRSEQVDRRNDWAYQRVLFPLVYPASVCGLLLVWTVGRKWNTRRRERGQSGA